MEDIFIICNESGNLDVTNDIKRAFFIANYEKDENKYSTIWIEGWNSNGMFAKFKEKDFLSE